MVYGTMDTLTFPNTKMGPGFNVNDSRRTAKRFSEFCYITGAKLCSSRDYEWVDDVDKQEHNTAMTEKA